MPPLKIKKRTKLSDSQLKSEIIALFNSGKTGKTDLFGIIRIKHTLSRDRYFKMYDACYLEWGKIKSKADKGATINAATQAAKIGLKSKLDKQLHIQKAIDDIQLEIDKGILEEYMVIGGALQQVEKIMNAETKAFLRKTIRELYSELNKMEGDYAPTKVAQTDSTGKDVNPIIAINQFNGNFVPIKEDEN